MKKRLFSLLLALCMVLSLLPFGASAAEIVDSGECGENLTWTLDADGLLTISGEGEMDSYHYYDNPNYPDGFYYQDVPPFYNRDDIHSIVIKPGVTNVGGSFFVKCSNLTSVTIANSVTSIQEQAFAFCPNLKSITIPDSVSEIGYDSFRACTSLTSITIPDSVSELQAAFRECTGLQTVVIPDSVLRIYYGAFQGCTGLASIDIPDSVNYIDSSVFQDCTSLKSIKIPNSVSKIYYSTFNGCSSLSSVSLPDSITEIEEYAFSGCTSLKRIVIPDSVIRMKYHVFHGCSALEEVVFSSNLSRIEWGTFSGCTGLQEITIPANMSKIESSAFEDCTGLREVTFLATMPLLESYVFSGCTSLERVHGLERAAVPAACFSDCTSIRRVTTGGDLGEQALQNCTALELVTMGGGSKIGSYALGGSTNLKAVCLPASLTEVEANAFRDAAALTDVYFAGTQEQWEAVNVRSAGNAPLLNAAVHFGATPLAVVSQPQDVSVNAGETASFSTLATLEDAAYQWQYSVDGETWLNIPDANVETLNLTAASGMDGRLYRCAISYGGETVCTDAVTLTVYSVPVIQAQPQAVTAHADDRATFSLSAVGENLSYQWQYSADGGTTWKNSTASSAKTHALSFTAKASFNGRLYRCVVSNPGASVTSDAVALTIAPKITKHPQDVSVNVGESITFSVSATGANLTYLWQYSTDGGETWKNSTAKKAASITMAGKVAYDGRLYRCAVTSGDTTIYSNPAMLKVDNPLVITKQPVSFAGAIGDMATFTVTAQGNGLTYRWEFSDDGGETWWQSTASSKTVKCRVTDDRDGRIYRCVVTDNIGRTVESEQATLTVIRTLEVTSQPESLAVEAGKTVKFRVTAQGEGLTYQWQLKTPRGEWKDTTAVSGKTAALSVVATAGKNAYQYRCVITDTNGNQVISKSAVLAVYQ